MIHNPPMHDELPDGEKVDNDDMNMRSQSLAGMEHHVRAAMGRKSIKDAFYYFEMKANRIKRWHNRLGTLSLVLLVIVLEFMLARLIAARFGFPDIIKQFTPFAVMLGIIPGACATLIYILHIRGRWILMRFKAERIRHWKFQQLLDGLYIESLQTEILDSDPVFDAKWQRLLNELNAGKGGMRDYVRNLPFSSPFIHRPNAYHPYASEKIFRSAATVFEQFRLAVQLNWFNQESERYQKSDQRTENVAGMLLLLSVAAAFLEGSLHFVPTLSTTLFVDSGLAAFGISMALLSAGVRVYRSASGVSESAERYQRLASQLHWYRDNFSRILDKDSHDPSSQEELFYVMVDIERLCHSELVEFIRVADKSDYFF